MFTCCPECKTCFRITNEQLAIAKGLVRCGHCHQVFNGGESLTEALPDEKPATQSPDKRHEADEHDSSIFAAEFSVSENETPENTPLENENDLTASSSDHFDLPSFSARDDFTETFTQDEAAVFTPPSEITDKQESLQISPPVDNPDDLFEALADDWFKQEKPEPTLTGAPDQAQTEDSYGYSDISDALKEEQNIDDIFSDMHQQLELGMAELEKKESETGVLDDLSKHNKNRNIKKEKTTVDDELEINQAIDNIFADSKLPLYGEKQEDPEYRVEKEMLAAFGHEAHIETSSDNIKFEDEAISITDIPRPMEEDLAVSSARPPEHEIPRRLRDSLTVAEPKKTSIWKVIGGLFLILLLSLALLIQLALFRNIEIIRYFPQARPWLEQFCDYAPCRIHARQAIDKIRILERDIHANPENKKALLITATIVNQASFSQPYPDIRVSLSDLTGTVVAQRRFSPADYLGSLNSPFLLMKPGTPVHIRIDVLDPGRDAVNFEFQFL